MPWFADAQIRHCWFTYQYQLYFVAVTLSLSCLL